MSDRTTMHCDVCGDVMGGNSKDESYVRPHVTESDGALRISFSGYYVGRGYESNVPPDGDTCSRACAIKMLCQAVAYLDEKEAAVLAKRRRGTGT